MFGSRCSLCNGKLNSRKICKECGLDNSKSEKYYKVNQSNCDDLPLTHVHENDWQVKKEKKKKKKKYSYEPVRQKSKDRNNGKKKSTISVLITLIIVVIGAIPTVLGIFETDTHTSAEPEYYSDSYNPYEYVEEELPESGDTLMYTLKSGQYVVGVHIAEGYYRATLFNESDSIEITDNMNGIYLYQSMYDESDDYLEDLRLYNGAVVTITSQDGLRLDTDNGQTGEIPALVENFVKDSYEMYGYDEAEAGVDFEPGIYDLSTDANYSYMELTVNDENGSEWEFRTYNLGVDGVHGPNFRNVVIPEGAVISCEDAGVKLTPSEYIWTTDYLEHYY